MRTIKKGNTEGSREGEKDYWMLTSDPWAGGRMAFREIPPVGLRGHIMSISGWLTGMGMDGTRPLAEQAESLCPGGTLWAEPLRLEEESLPGRREAEFECERSGEVEEEEEEETWLWVRESLRGEAAAEVLSLMVTDLDGFDMT